MNLEQFKTLFKPEDRHSSNFINLFNTITRSCEFLDLQEESYFDEFMKNFCLRFKKSFSKENISKINTIISKKEPSMKDCIKLFDLCMRWFFQDTDRFYEFILCSAFLRAADTINRKKVKKNKPKKLNA